MLRKASGGGEKTGGSMANNWREKQRRAARVRTVVEGFSPTGQQGLSQDGAQVSAGPGEAVISCP